MIGQTEIDAIEVMRRISLKWLQRHRLSLPEAEDLFQQSIVKALTTESGLAENQKISSWFFQILKNAAFDYFRSQKLHHSKEKEYAFEEQLHAFDQDFEEGFCSCVKGYLKDLPNEDQMILEKHFFEGMTLKKIAESSGLSEGNIRIKALRAREKLRGMFRGCCNAKSLQDLSDCGCEK